MPNTSTGSGELVGEAVATSYLPMSAGVMASGATVIGDSLIAEAIESESLPIDPVSTIAPTESKTSVFDSPAVVEIDSIVDSLAEDTAAARGDRSIAMPWTNYSRRCSTSTVGGNRP